MKDSDKWNTGTDGNSGLWRKRVKQAAVAASILASLIGGAAGGAEFDDYFDTNVCVDDD